MNLKLHNKNFNPPHNLRRVITRQAAKVRKVLPTFKPEDLDLHVTIEQLPRGNQFHTALVLTTPQNVIRVEELEDNPTRSVLDAFRELGRRIKKFKSQLNREQFWKKQEIAFTEPTPSKPDLESIISENLDKVENYIRRELYYQTLLETIPPGILQPQALVDQVFLEVSSQAGMQPANVSPDQWIFQVARSVIQRRIESLEEREDDSHLEEEVRPAERWDDEELNFYQPDEVLHLEDLLTDRHVSTPEEFLEREETEASLHRAIAHLPEETRESFVLFALEGFNSDEVAMITGKTPEQVLKEVEEARSRLKQLVR